MINRDVFYVDPATRSIPNDGVAKVLEPRTPEEWEVLRYELSAFVCEGQYRQGLERILLSYLTHLEKPSQPAAWVSGFYGSGKSHLVRVLEYLWRDIEFPDGVRARGLTKLPGEINEYLRELTAAGRREGGLWSAAGTLGASAGSSIRLAVLSVLLRSAELPAQYPAARLAIWLKQNGFYDAVESAVRRAGRELDRELNNMYVSPVLADALLEAYPGFASSSVEVRTLLQAQYPNKEDISDDELLSTFEDVLALQSTTPGRLPCTLLVFDELQQFVGEDPDRTLRLQTVVEALSSRFRGNLLFVGTGQSALQALPQLSKLQARFTIKVQLSDTDVEQVVREVVLRKRPDRMAELQRVLDAASGEIDRHLAGTAIAPRPEDADDLPADYPLLPVRRRFWEGALRAVDTAGTTGQLRTQLRIVHEATRDVAGAPLGTVVAGDVVYDQLKQHMLQTGVLLRETHNFIEEQRADGASDGELRARLCAAIFLIGKLPTEGVSNTGVTATADTLADLLVTDLPAGSAGLRQRIPALLQELVDDSKLLQVGEEYRLQTRESAVWDQDYRQRLVRISSDDNRIASDRTDELRAAMHSDLKGITLTQGVSRTPRKHALHFGLDEPPTNTGVVPIWVRDEWSVSEKGVREEAQAAGMDSPIVFVFLPRRDADALRGALARYAAAKETLDLRPVPSTPEGQEAQRAMVSRRDAERRNLDARIRDVVDHARVFQGGGYEVDEGSPQASARVALGAAVQRLFPNFGVADHARWGTVFDRARQGAPDALSAVDYTGDPEKHPASQLIMNFVGAGKKGSEVRAAFEGAGYGWPRDAVDASLLVLSASGSVEARVGGDTVKPSQITRQSLGATDFRRVTTVVTAAQRIGVRKLLTDMTFPVRSGEEAAAIPSVLQRLTELAHAAGGDAPLPERPSIATISHLQSLSGNEQFVAVYDRRDELLRSYRNWTNQGDLIRQRLPRWERLLRLRRHAEGLPLAIEPGEQIEGIRQNRWLLANPDPVAPLTDAIADALRSSLHGVRRSLAGVREQEMSDLEASGEWQQLTETERAGLVSKYGLAPVPDLNVGTDEALLRALDAMPLTAWTAEVRDLPARAARAREEAAKLLEPEIVTVRPPRRTLRDESEVDAYLHDLRSEIIQHIRRGNPVML
jgi:hypothetical protein